MSEEASSHLEVSSSIENYPQQDEKENISTQSEAKVCKIIYILSDIIINYFFL